ncbi:MAG: LysR family transcriptional regulator [Elainellaceae cyanobacterium]
MDKFEALRAFTRVVEQGSFAAAAREMGQSRSSVNKLVIQLENQLGAQLLQRTTRKVSLTATGLAFYERCLGILADLEEAELAVMQLHDEPRGDLRINAPMSFGQLHVGPAIADFMAQYPQLCVQLTLEDRFVDPIAEGFDVVIRIAAPPESPSLVVHAIAPMPRLLCAAPAYLQQHGVPGHPRELRQHRCLHYGYLASGKAWQLTGPDGEHRVPVQSALCSNNGEVLHQAALKGLGIVLLPKFILKSESQAGRLQHILPDYAPPEAALSIIYPSNRHLSTKVRLLQDFLSDRFRDL